MWERKSNENITFLMQISDPKFRHIYTSNDLQSNEVFRLEHEDDDGWLTKSRIIYVTILASIFLGTLILCSHAGWRCVKKLGQLSYHETLIFPKLFPHHPRDEEVAVGPWTIDSVHCQIPRARGHYLHCHHPPPSTLSSGTLHNLGPVLFHWKKNGIQIQLKEQVTFNDGAEWRVNRHSCGLSSWSSTSTGFSTNGRWPSVVEV